MVDLEADDCPGDLADDVVEEPGHHLEGAEDGAGAAALVLHLEADGLVVVDLDLAEDVVLDEALEDGAVDLAEELA